MDAGRPLQVPDSAALFSLVPISALPAILSRTAGGERLIALSSSNISCWAQSTDPGERRLARDFMRAEEEVQSHCKDRKLTLTLFRPTLIYDPGHDRNVSTIAALARRFGAFPIVWPGTGRRQPIHSDDVASAMAAALGAPRAYDAVLALPGGETLIYRDMVRRIFRSQARRPILIYVPLRLAKAAFAPWNAITGMRYSSASLDRMNVDLVFDPEPIREILGLTPRPFNPVFPAQRDQREAPPSA